MSERNKYIPMVFMVWAIIVLEVIERYFFVLVIYFYWPAKCLANSSIKKLLKWVIMAMANCLIKLFWFFDVG